MTTLYVVSEDYDEFSGGHRIAGVFSTQPTAEEYRDDLLRRYPEALISMTAVDLDRPIDFSHHAPPGVPSATARCVACHEPFPCSTRYDVRLSGAGA